MDDSSFLEELKKDFYDEAYKLVEMLESNILILENEPGNKEAINEIFRAAHTLKGGSATIDLDRIARFTHEMESLLDEIRSDKIKVSPDIVDILLKSIDIVKMLLNVSINNEQAEAGFEDEILEKLKVAYSRKESSSEEKIQIDTWENLDFKLTEYAQLRIVMAGNESKRVLEIQVLLNQDNPMKMVSAIQVYAILKELGEIIATIPTEDELMDDRFHPRIAFVITTLQTEEWIYSKLNISDVVDQVKISPFQYESDETESSQFKGQDVDFDDLEKWSIEERNQIESLLDGGKELFKISIDFDEKNPMRSVSALLLTTMIQGVGTIVKSVPDSEMFKQELFIPKVQFIVGTDLDMKTLQKKLYLSDVTQDITIMDVDSINDKMNKGLTPILDVPLEPLEKTFNTEISETDINKEILESNSPKTISTKSKPSSQPSMSVSSTNLRVESKRIDKILNLVGELVTTKASYTEITENDIHLNEEYSTLLGNFKKEIKLLEQIVKNQLKLEDSDKELLGNIKSHLDNLIGHFDPFYHGYRQQSEKLKVATQSLTRTSNELQESVMKIRMVSINQIFSRIPRLVRDLSKSLRKEVRLEIFGEDTELDKSLIEELVDPIIHLVRNSIDHGIEYPDKRVNSGKDSEGFIRLKASHEGNFILIEVSDDGNGIDSDKVLKKALEKNIIDNKTTLSHEEIMGLIFAPGFSTADEISSVSGRGVGMDVVKKKIESLSGTIQIKTEKGKGTTILIKLPLTLAIIQALMVKVNHSIFCIPINNVIETLRVPRDTIERLENYDIIRVRDELVTLIYLDRVFKMQSLNEGKLLYVIIVSVGERKVGLVVDFLIGEQDLVIKPISNRFAESQGIAGAAILGDGSVSLIIDINELMELVNLQENEVVEVY